MNNTFSVIPRISLFRKSYNSNNFWGRLLTKQFWAYLVISLCGLLAYFPVFQNKFQDKWDDQWVVINDYTHRGFTIDNIWSILTEYYHGQYAPANQLYYTILHSLAGYDPRAFHAASLLIHLLNSCLVYLLLTKLLPLIFKSDQHNDQTCKIALLSSIIFVIHPINAEAVAWVAASKILIYSFFYLLALNMYVNYLRQPRSINYVCILALFTLSFAGKEQAVTFPVCMLLISYFAGNKIFDKNFWLDKIPFFVLSLFFGWVTIESQAAVGTGLLSASEQYPFHQRLAFASYSVIEYATKCLLPIKLSYIYHFPNLVGEALPVRFYFYPIALLPLIVFGWEACKKPIVLFGVLFFLIHISLTIHIIPISRFAITADRYAYISSISGCLCISLSYVFLQNRFSGHLFLINIVTLILLGVLFGYTNVRARVWKDTVTLKKEVKRILESRKHEPKFYIYALNSEFNLINCQFW